MTTRKTPLLALTLTSTVASVALANPGNVDPKLPKEVQPMYCLVGQWKSQNGLAVMGGKRHKVDFTVSCAPTSQGLAILCTSKFDIEGLGHVEETDMFGYDPGQNRYHWFATTGMGESHDHVALPPGPKSNSITFAYSGVQDGKPMQEVLTMTLPDKAGKRIEFLNNGVVGGQPAWKISATMIKK